jgi:hypothetical protein
VIRIAQPERLRNRDDDLSGGEDSPRTFEDDIIRAMRAQGLLHDLPPRGWSARRRAFCSTPNWSRVSGLLGRQVGMAARLGRQVGMAARLPRQVEVRWVTVAAAALVGGLLGLAIRASVLSDGESDSATGAEPPPSAVRLFSPPVSPALTLSMSNAATGEAVNSATSGRIDGRTPDARAGGTNLPPLTARSVPSPRTATSASASPPVAPTTPEPAPSSPRTATWASASPTVAPTTPEPVHSPTTAPPPNTDIAVPAQFISPQNGGMVSSQQTVIGTAPTVPSRTVWLVVLPTQSPQFWPQPGPLTLDRNGRFSSMCNFGVNQSMNRGEEFTVMMISATSGADQVFRNFFTTGQNTRSGLVSLPSGAQIISKIIVTRS